MPAGYREAMEDAIAARPEAHPVIPGTGGFRKARWPRPGSGKRGGVRVIYYLVVEPATVYFVTIYAKNQKENLTDAEKKALKAFAKVYADSAKR